MISPPIAGSGIIPQRALGDGIDRRRWRDVLIRAAALTAVANTR
jgi:hypothetical protein